MVMIKLMTGNEDRRLIKPVLFLNKDSYITFPEKIIMKPIHDRDEIKIKITMDRCGNLLKKDCKNTEKEKSWSFYIK